MMPIVDALMHLPAGTTCDSSAKASLDDYLVQHTEFHILRALAVQPMLSSTESAAHARQLQTLATTRGSGGLPHGVLVHVALNELLDSHSHLSLEQPYFRGFSIQINNKALMRSEIEKASFVRSHTELESAYAVVNIAMAEVTQVNCRAILDVLENCSTIRFVLQFDHVFSGKGTEKIVEYFLTEYSQYENAFITIAGFYAQQHGAGVEPMTAIITRLVRLFGYERVMFGSNYPNLLVYASYDALWRTYSAATAGFTATNRDKLFRSNALGLYRL